MALVAKKIDDIGAIIEQASALQAQAANPLASAWVDASAGSGKTKVLTDRVLSLLLLGAEPRQLLCLTYTKAAAGEMQRRLRQTLATWTTLPDAELQHAVGKLVSPTPDIVQRARSLFAVLIDDPVGVPMQTVHSFCEGVLRQFPVEAGLPPSFEQLEEGQDKLLLKQALIEACSLPDYQQNLEFLATHTAEGHLQGLLEAVISQRRLLRDCFQQHHDGAGVQQALQDVLQTDGTAPNDTELLSSCLPDHVLQEWYLGCVEGSKTDGKRAQKLQHWLHGERQDVQQYCGLFLKQDGGVFAKFGDKAANLSPELVALLQAEGERLSFIKQQQELALCFQKTMALLEISLAVWAQYSLKKKILGVVDYEDLIEHTVNLMKLRDSAEWVRYKLDQRLQHLLVDEAQDTSPAQWDLVQALTAEFFTLQEDGEAPRTVFVVGDYKQSIYSFQGAAPALFRAEQGGYAAKVENSGNHWAAVPMATSFRSSPVVLEFVDAVFNNSAAGQGVRDSALQHFTAKLTLPGRVELWPLLEPTVKESKPWQFPWEVMQGEETGSSNAKALAEQIADNISNWLQNGEPVVGEGTGTRPMQPGDIMILLQKRTKLAGPLRRALSAQGVPVMPPDKVTLAQEPAVQDLLSMGNFLVNPRDDLALAEVLRSPILNNGGGISEGALFALCYQRGEHTLWQRLQDSSHHALAEQLKKLRKAVGYSTPAAVYSLLLNEQQGREALLARLGESCLDAITLFEDQLLEYAKQQVPTLQGFLAWFAEQNIQMKREATGEQNMVRVLTAHGSKGLEAPVVILADAHETPYYDSKLPVYSDQDKLFVWGSKGVASVVGELHDQAIQAGYEEYHRLLYVAMTRAEQRLCFAGIAAKETKTVPVGQAPERSWYAAAQQGVVALVGEGATVYQPPMRVVEEQPENRQEAPKNITIPDWLQVVAKPEPVQGTAPVTGASDAPKSQQVNAGIIMHRLLQALPDLPEDTWQDYAAQQGGEELFQAAAAIVRNPDFAWLFGEASRAEVPVFGKTHNDQQYLAGRIDRLVVDDGTVHIIDYKTGTPPVSGYTKLQQQQVAAYARLLAEVYPGCTINASLLWTSTAQLVDVPLQAAQVAA